MSAKTFRLIITDIEGPKFEGDAVSATVPGKAGEMTILADHEPIVTTLRPGTITARTESGGAQEFRVEKGVLECSRDGVTILL